MKDLRLRLDFRRSLVSRTAAGNRAYLRLTSWGLLYVAKRNETKRNEMNNHVLK